MKKQNNQNSMDNSEFPFAKRTKFDGFDLNLDPFQRLFDVHDLIYQHLTANDIIRASEVSKEWNENIDESRVCMKKISLNFVPESQSCKNISERDKYVDGMECILNSKRRYTKLSFKSHRTVIIPDRAKVLTAFANSMVDLKVAYTYNMTMKPAKFPNLKSLEIGKYVTRPVMKQLFEAIKETELEKLVVRWQSVDKVLKVIRYLKIHQGLKELGLDWINSLVVFNRDDISFLCRLQLEKLTMTDLSSTHYGAHASLNPNIRSNIEEFLASQAATLTHVVLHGSYLDVIGDAMKLPNLKYIEVNAEYIDIETLATNDSIVAAKIINLRVDDPRFIALFNRLPNLTHLIISHLKESQVITIAERVQKLEQLCYIVGNEDIAIHNVKKVSRSFEFDLAKL